MSSRARNATSLLALAAVAAIAALLVSGATSGGGAAAATQACGAATADTYRAAAEATALRINHGERFGGAVRGAVSTVAGDRVLANAVAAGQLATVHSEMLALLFNHEHIVRIRVRRGSRLLYDIGGPLVLAPATGTLRVGGRVVGSFAISVQDDLGYRILVERLVGAHVVISYGGAVVMRDIAVRPVLPASGVVRTRRRTYLAAAFTVPRFPRGTLDVLLLVRSPAAALARRSCAQVRADALAGFARRAYNAASNGPAVRYALDALVRTTALPVALANHDYATAAHLVDLLIAHGGFARLRLESGGRVIADRGASVPLVDPVTHPIVDASGAVVGDAVFTVQNARSFANLAHFLTGAHVLVRAGSHQLAGTVRGPAVVPSSGPITYRGRSYVVSSFAGVRFPSGALVIYVLDPA